MTKKALEKKIVELLPSKTLKDYVSTNDFHFQEKDLLKFIIDYAKTFSQKLSLLEAAATLFQDKENKIHAKKLIQFHQKMYDEFMQTSDDAVYEIEIHCNPDDASEKNYIVKTFEDVLILIRNYWKCYGEYGAKDNILSKYIITKKTCFPPKKPSDLDRKVGEFGYSELGHKLVIKDVMMYTDNTEFGKCKGKICQQDCKKICISAYEINYPPFLKKYELVAYKEDWAQTQPLYGILVSDLNKYCNDSEVVLLDNPYIKNRDAFSKDEDGYFNIYIYHDHPAYAILYRPNLDEVDKGILEDYHYAVEALKKIESSLKE
ncbi:MAG: hypothetical protein K2N42_01420 [Anaeroplasmataceae bacterium]|nr:hypothetical protein [Anaeroplasmataceae bacterium]